MQAIGIYAGGRMLFMGLGTGLGVTLIIDGVVEPTEFGHLPYKRGLSFEDYVGERGRRVRGNKKWRRTVTEVIEHLKAALEVEYVVLGGGNAVRLTKLPGLGNEHNALLLAACACGSPGARRFPPGPRGGAAAAPDGRRAGCPGLAPIRCSSAKEIVGCSSVPRAWFTVGGGIINEVYYPRVDCRNPRPRLHRGRCAVSGSRSSVYGSTVQLAAPGASCASCTTTSASS
jgi:hypothetical protein